MGPSGFPSTAWPIDDWSEEGGSRRGGVEARGWLEQGWAGGAKRKADRGEREEHREEIERREKIPTSGVHCHMTFESTKPHTKTTAP
jgi:hypothetical protein